MKYIKGKILLTILGKFKIDNNFIPALRNPNYNKMAYRQFSNFYLNLFYSPKKNFLPWSTIEVHPKKDLPVQDYKDSLTELNEKYIEEYQKLESENLNLKMSI